MKRCSVVVGAAEILPVLMMEATRSHGSGRSFRQGYLFVPHVDSAGP